MTSPNDTSTSDDVLNEYASQPGGPSHAALVQWIKRYPQFRQELTEFTVAWTLQDGLPPAEDAEDVDTDTLVLRGMSVVEDLLHRQEKAAQVGEDVNSASDFESLMAVAHEVDLDLQGLADSCDLSVSMMAKLNRRLIEISSIPAQLVQQFASTLRLSSSSIHAYFQRPIALASGAHYRSNARPAQSSSKENFFEAVRMDPGLSDSQRTRWLALQPASEP